MNHASSLVAEAARALRVAEEASIGIAPLIETWPELDLDTAYAIQLENVRRRVDRGARILGHKVGLTSKAMQDMLGIDQPDYGHLLDGMFYRSGDCVQVDRFVAPRIEPEVAFVLGATLEGPECDGMTVLRATRAVVPALELIDSRVEGWRIGLLDTIADNASSGAVVLGDEVPLTHDMDMRDLSVQLLVDDEVVAVGTTDAVLGHPANAVAWLVNTLHERGVRLEAGHTVMPGSCTNAVDAIAGCSVRAEFNRIGDVAIDFA